MNEITTTADGGAAAIAPRGSNAATVVAQTREMAEAVAAMQMAKACPRDEIRARDRILNACSRPKLAECACYTYARGGTDVTGPSIRLAEMLAQNWGNISFGIRELEQRNGESTCEAFAWDMETNSRQTKVFQVPHVRHTNRGDKRLTDPRDIYELVANNGARRLRACILGIIPGDVVDEAVEACDRTLKTKFEVTPERVKKMLDTFAEYGVSKERVEARIQCRAEAVKPAQLANLGKIANSIRDGMSKPEDWFPKAEDGGAAKDAERPQAKGIDRLREVLGVKEDGGRGVAAEADAEASEAAAEARG